MGEAGASLGTLVAEFVVLIVQIMYLKDLFFKISKQVQYWKVLVALVLASIISIKCSGVVDMVFLKINSSRYQLLWDLWHNFIADERDICTKLCS